MNRFVERALPYGRPGIEIGIEVTAVRHDEHTRYGHIQVLDTVFYGRMLVIDGIVQTSVSDEFVYHEMLALTPLLWHGAAANCLIVGGGDGGALRQLLRGPAVTAVTQVEIDPAVVRVSRDHLPEVSGGGFDDPRTELIFDDGAAFLARTRQRYDVLLLDLTDPLPDSPAEGLFEESFLRVCKGVLAPGGVLAMQCGSLLFQPEEVAAMRRRLGAVFDHVELRHAVVPSYQLTSFGFLFGSDAPPPTPPQVAERAAALTGGSRYLSPEVYGCATVLPPYLAQSLDPATP